MSSSFVKYNCFVENLAEKVHNLGADTLKVALSNTAPDAADAVLADAAEISAGNGYTAGGNTLVISTSPTASNNSLNIFHIFLPIKDTVYIYFYIMYNHQYMNHMYYRHHSY